MVDPYKLKSRIEEIKKILELENDNVQIGIIPEEYCDVEPYCNYKAVYQKDNNAIFIHPNSFLNHSFLDLTAFVAHELYHAYQYKTEPSLYDTQINQNYQDVGLDYIKQPLEMQAYAFQTAIIMLYEEVYAKFELEGVDTDTLDKINDLAKRLLSKIQRKI